MEIKILSKKEVKGIIGIIQKQYAPEDMKLDYTFLKGGKDKIYITNKKIKEINTKELRVNSAGLYFGRVDEGKIRLSIEGSQLIGPYARKNVATIKKQEIEEWVKGLDISTDGNYDGFVIVKYGKDFFGTGRYSNGKITNFVPKERRIKF